MDPTVKLFISLAIFSAGNALFIWLASCALLRNMDPMTAARASVYQLLLWIPVAFVLLILVIPLGADVSLPTQVSELKAHTGALLVAVFVTGMLGVKWSYERNLRASVLVYGLALAVQAGAYLVLFDKKPEWRHWLPSLEHLPLIGN